MLERGALEVAVVEGSAVFLAELLAAKACIQDDGDNGSRLLSLSPNNRITHMLLDAGAICRRDVSYTLWVHDCIRMRKECRKIALCVAVIGPRIKRQYGVPRDVWKLVVRAVWNTRASWSSRWGKKKKGK